MIARWVRALLILPLFGLILYLISGALYAAVPTAQVVFGVLLASNAVFLLPRVGSRIAGWILAAITLVSLLGLLGLAAPSFTASLLPLSEALLGIWLALPFLAIGVLVLSEASLPELMFTFQAALVDALILVGAVQNIAASGRPYTPESVLTAYGNEIASQLIAWIRVVTGRGVYGFPLQSVNPQAFFLFALVGFVGVLLLMLEPPDVLRQSLFEPGPSASHPDAPPVADSMEAVLASASTPTTPPTLRAPGLGPLIMAGIAMILTLAVAILAPSWVLVLLVGGTIVVVVGGWVTASSRRPPASALPRSGAKTAIEPASSTPPE